MRDIRRDAGSKCRLELISHSNHRIPHSSGSCAPRGRRSVYFYVIYFLDTLSVMSELTKRGSKKKGAASQVSVPDVFRV